MKKETIIKIVVSIIVFATVILLEVFGLSFMKNYKILFCNSNQSIDIKDELAQITGALPNTGTYSVKMVTSNDEKINIYYMYDGQINNYEVENTNLPTGSVIYTFIGNNSIEGQTLYYSIIITTTILLAIIITYVFITKKTVKGIIKIGYFLLSISVLTFLLCIIPLLSKNHGGGIYYYSIVLGSFLIGLLYGYKNKAFFIPTILMFPIYIVATWLNYRNGMLWIDEFGGYLFLNFIGALTGRILEKNKGIKKKHIVLYAIITILLLISSFAGKIMPRTLTALISDCCKLSLWGIVFSLIVFIIYIVIKKVKDVTSKTKEASTLEKTQQGINNADTKNSQQDVDNAKAKKHTSKSNVIKTILELVIVITLIAVSIGANIYYLRPHNNVEAILNDLPSVVSERYYRIIENTVYVTTDFGENWIEVPAQFSNIYMTDKEFADDSYYLGENKIIFENNNGQFISLIYSDDNGATWQNGLIAETSGYIVYMNFFNKNNGIAMVCTSTELGQREHLRASITYDGGKTWTTQKGEKSRIRINRGAKIEFTSINDGRIENISYDGTKTVYVTNDAGKTWKQEKKY